MQENQQIAKPQYLNTWTIFSKLILTLIISYFVISCGQKETKQVLSVQNQKTTSESAININIASPQELEKLPQIGAKMAQEIIIHREKFGRFRKPEHLLFVRGISDRRFREIRNLVKVE